MFAELPPPNRKRWDFALLASFAVHIAGVLVMAHHSAPVFIMPSDVALGTPGSAGSVIYLAPVGVERAFHPPERPKLELRTAKSALPRPLRPPPDQNDNEDGADSAKLDATAIGGSAIGSRIPGAPLTGHEVIPALPQVFPDPSISRTDLPAGVEGDVIVEVTIDERGNVVELKLIRGIGYGIEDRVLATLRQWHFRPASKDGVTIASQHIVTFHYPS